MKDLILDIPGGKLKLAAIDDGIIHVVYTRAQSFCERPSVIIVPQDDAKAQRVRCSRRALTSDQGR